MSAALLIDLAGVARLADVRRPTASMWRTRFESSDDPFPTAVTKRNGRAFFDAMSVADWLSRTDHGNNPDVVADAAAAAMPPGFDVSDATHVATVDALLALRATSGRAVGGSGASELQRRARSVDPDDACLLTELSEAPPAWTEWADLLSDAAYSPLEASRLLERRHAASRSSEGSSGPLGAECEALLTSLSKALIAGRRMDVALNGGVAPSLATALAAFIDLGELRVPQTTDGRKIRRRLLCDGIEPPAADLGSDAAQLFIERQPISGSHSIAELLEAVDELALRMRDQDRALFIAPASALAGRLDHENTQTRADSLRSGRVRAIVKLPVGLVPSAPREALAIWVLGRETGDVPIAERFTAVADLTGVSMSAATRADLTSDVVAAMGSAVDVRAHAFRFTRLVRTTSLLAGRGALVNDRTASGRATPSTRDLPALLDQALTQLGDDSPAHVATAVRQPTITAASVEALVAQRHLKSLPGIRLAPGEVSTSGLVVVGADDLSAPAHIGRRRIDPMEFAARHPSARLTAPGDIVFRTAPSPRAWVDHDGSKIVAYPARVLRINRTDTGGLVPALVAADIERSPGGPGAWRNWMLRRVAPPSALPLDNALTDIAARREALARRIDALDRYAELLTDAVVSGAVTVSDPAANAASDPL